MMSVWETPAEIPYWWCVHTNQNAGQGSASGWLCSKENLLQPVRNTIQIWIVTGHPCRISALVPQTTVRSLSVCVAVVVIEIRACLCSQIIWQRNHWWCRKMLPVFSGCPHQLVRKDKKDLKNPLNKHLCKVDTSGTNQEKFQWHFFNWKKFPVNSDQSNPSCFDQNSGYFKISVLWDWFWFNQSCQSGPPSDMSATFSWKCLYSDRSVTPTFKQNVLKILRWLKQTLESQSDELRIFNRCATNADCKLAGKRSKHCCRML